MRIHLYSMCLNEVAVLPFFFRHYDPWVERYVIYDNGSQDGTLDMLANHPRVEVRRFPRSVPDSFVMSARILHNTMWKESRGNADWVIVTAIDEHLYHAEFGAYLAHCKKMGVTAIPALGFQMASIEFPQPEELLCETRTFGTPHAGMSKLSLFNPDAVEETRYALGRHWALPVRQIKYPPEDQLLLLHYKNLGLPYLMRRNKMLSGALGARDKKRGWARYYDDAEASLRESFAVWGAQSVDIRQPALPLLKLLPISGRWWRGNPLWLPIVWRIKNRWLQVKSHFSKPPVAEAGVDAFAPSSAVGEASSPQGEGDGPENSAHS